MNVFLLIRAKKTNVVIGSWQTGKIPATSFPINRPKSIPTGGAWRWRLCEFDAAGFHCRVLIRLNEEIQRYHAYLAVDSGKSVRVVCHHELHIGDKGWHCHFSTGRIEDTMEGVLRDKALYRMRETHPSQSLHEKITVNKANALTKAAKRYRFEAEGELV